MVGVPAGAFWMGCTPGQGRCEDWQQRRTEIYLDAFEIDVYETTLAEYRECVDAGACSAKLVSFYTLYNSDTGIKLVPGNRTADGAPMASSACEWGVAEHDRYPMNCVTWLEADAYCRWRGKRLPTSAEWEKAARGTDERIYPWGNSTPTCRHAIAFDGGVWTSGAGGCGRTHSWPVGSTPDGASPYGAYDMAGNVEEWIADFFDDKYMRAMPTRNPKGPASGDTRMVRGGEWSVVRLHLLQTTSVTSMRADIRGPATGIRCVR